MHATLYGVNRRALAAVTTALAAGCSGGSGTGTLGSFVPARGPALLAIAHPGTGLQLVSGTGLPVRLIRLPAPLTGGGSPAWSPDGRQLAFLAGTDAPAKGPLLPATDVYVVDATGGTPTRVTHEGVALWPVWSPDGRWIAYSAVSWAGHGARTAAIWIVHPDGTGATRLTHPRHGAYDFAGPYNPRTGRIAFTRCARPVLLRNGMEPDTCAVWTMNPDATDQRRLAAESEEPAWSPDGRRIAFASARDHAARIRVGEDEDSWIRQLYVMNADGSGQRRLLDSAASDRLPAWAPGGDVIAFETTSLRTSQTGVAAVNAGGTCRRTMSPPAGRLDAGYHSPAWRPGGVVARLVC
jgi:TolB protein